MYSHDGGGVHYQAQRDNLSVEKLAMVFVVTVKVSVLAVEARHIVTIVMKCTSRSGGRGSDNGRQHEA